MRSAVSLQGVLSISRGIRTSGKYGGSFSNPFRNKVLLSFRGATASDWRSDNQEERVFVKLRVGIELAANEVVIFLTRAAGAIKTILSRDEWQLVRRPRHR